MRLRCALIFIVLFCCAQLRAQFSALIQYGHSIPVCTWNGQGPILGFAARSLEENEDAQGALVILGRDPKSVWYLRHHYPDDASDRGALLMLERIDTTGKIYSYPNAPDLPGDTTFYDAFIHMFTSVFNKHNLQQLTPVETWSCARNYEWVAQVNSSALHHCFQWNLNVTDDPDDGSCVFYFGWDAAALPFQQTRDVAVYDCVLSIPFNWTYHVTDTFHGGYIADAGDTLFFSQSVAMKRLPVEMTAYKYPSGDSALYAAKNADIRRYNDSLRRTNPMLVTHTDSTVRHRDAWFTYCYPKPGVAGRMNLEKKDMAGESFLLYTTVLSPQRQVEFKQLLASLEWR